MATFNAYWLFTNDLSNTPWADANEARAHVADVALTLDALKADIIVLQEVEDCETLELLRSALRDADSYRSIFVQASKPQRSHNSVSSVFVFRCTAQS